MSASFSAQSHRINLGSAAGLDDLAEWTVAMWLRPSSIDSNDRRFLYKTANFTLAMGDYTVGITTYSSAVQVIRAHAGTNAQATTTGGHFAADEWTYVVASMSSGSVIKVYIGGENALVTEASYAQQVTGVSTLTTDAGGNLQIGRQNTPNRHFLGLIGPYAIWDRALSLGEIRQTQWASFVAHYEDCLVYSKPGFQPSSDNVTNWGTLQTDGDGALQGGVTLAWPDPPLPMFFPFQGHHGNEASSAAQQFSQSIGYSVGVGISTARSTSKAVDYAIGLGASFARSTSKSLGYAIGISHSATKLATKALSYSVGVGHSVAKMASRSLAFAIGAGYSTTKQCGVLLAYAIGAGHSMARSIGKSLAYSVGVGLSTTKRTTKSIAFGLGVGSSIVGQSIGAVVVLSVRGLVAYVSGAIDSLKMTSSRETTAELTGQEDQSQEVAGQSGDTLDVGGSDSDSAEV